MEENLQKSSRPRVLKFGLKLSSGPLPSFFKLCPWGHLAPTIVVTCFTKKYKGKNPYEITRSRVLKFDMKLCLVDTYKNYKTFALGSILALFQGADVLYWLIGKLFKKSSCQKSEIWHEAMFCWCTLGVKFWLPSRHLFFLVVVLRWVLRGHCGCLVSFCCMKFLYLVKWIC